MTQADTKQDNGADRRNFFRVNDNIVLRYRVLPQVDLAQLAEEQAARPLDRFTVAAGFAGRSQEMRPLLNVIQNRSPEVAKYLSALDDKLNQMARLFMMQELEGEENVSREVSLGAGGMGFVSQHPVVEGSLLELRILLPTSALGLIATGRVVRCTENQESGERGYWLAIEFTHIREQDRDLLVRHLLGKQLSERRQQKAG